jgi:twitching motility protein PilT
MIDLINRTAARHIVTLEDPIEFMHESRRALVDQREVSTDTPSFHQALRAVFRQDPDVVLIGELRDLDSIRTALTLAETGHLTLATVHANSAAQTINRLIDAFPSGQQEQIRSQLSLTLEGVITQALIPRLKGGRILALEIMLGISSVRALIRDGKIHQLYGIIQAGQSHGMRTMNSSLLDLVRKREIDTMHALSVSPKPDELSGYLA